MQKQPRQILPNRGVVDMVNQYTPRYYREYQDYVGGHTDIYAQSAGNFAQELMQP